MSYGIYSITNQITGDKYIGQTKVSFEDRWKRHVNSLKSNNHDNDYLQKAWNKYGEGAFEFKAIHICDELDILNDLEIYYIKKYDTFNNGYNLTSGGDCFNYEISEETRLKINEKAKEAIRNKSDYTEHQVANLKVLLTDETYIGKIKKISEITGIRENVIYSIKNLNSWIDVREDLNEKIKSFNDKELRNKSIINDFAINKMTIEELISEYNLTQTAIYSILKSNGFKNKLAKINKENQDLKLETKILEAYNNGIDNYSDMEKEIGISRPTIERLVSNYDDISLNKFKKKKTTVKNINWDENSQRYLIRLTKNKKQIVIGGVKDLNKAIEIRDKAKEYIENNQEEELNNLINSLKSNNNFTKLNDDKLSSELEKYNIFKPKNIRVDKRPKQLPRFEVYVKNKYIGSSKILDEAIKIRDEYLKTCE